MTTVLTLSHDKNDQISKITEFFDNPFSSDEIQISVTPERMEPPFIPEEIQKGSQKVKNNKSPCGIPDLWIESTICKHI